MTQVITIKVISGEAVLDVFGEHVYVTAGKYLDILPPAGWRLVPEPELFDKGIPNR